MEKKTILELLDLLEELNEEKAITDREYQELKLSLNSGRKTETVDILGIELPLEKAYDYFIYLKQRKNPTPPEIYSGVISENIFDRENISFHGLRHGYNFPKLKKMLQIGILPGNMLSYEESNSHFKGELGDQVFLTVSPKVSGRFKHRAFDWYVSSSLGIVIDKPPIGVNPEDAFPDAGYSNEPIDRSSFIGITIDEKVWNLSAKDVRAEAYEGYVMADGNVDDLMMSDLLDQYNISKLPIYDSNTGKLLKSYQLEDNIKQL